MAFSISVFSVFQVCTVYGQQQAAYINYDSMVAGLTQKVKDMLRERTVTGMNTAQRNVLNTITFSGIDARLPKQRTKELTAEEVYRTCKQSSLAYGKYVKSEQNKEHEAKVIASAIALTEDGICASNYHVITEIILPGAAATYYNKNDSLRFVATADGKIYPVKEVLAYDSGSDLAVFRVDVGKDKLHPIPMGKPALEGAPAYAITHPKKMLFYFTAGVVARNINTENWGKQVNLMQITTDYAGGSSGGPIIDRYGNLIGMVSTTNTLYNDDQLKDFPQMIVKTVVPVITIRSLFK